LEGKPVTQKRDYYHPLTADELAKAKLFKISAEIDLELYRMFKAECGARGLKMKEEIAKAIANHLKMLEKS